MARTEDRRVRRTRAALLEALLSLMIEKGYDAITVQDLIDRADVGRSTFYAHFTDKADLLEEAMTGLRATVSGGPGEPPPDRRRPLRFGLRMFRHVADQHRLMTAILGSPGGGAVIARIEAILRDVALAELETLAAASGGSEEPRVPLDLLARDVVATVLATLTWWVGHGHRETPEELDALVQIVTAPGIRAAIPAGTPPAR